MPTPKRIKIWERSTKLTDEFLVKEIGINPSRSKEVVEKLKAQDVITVGALIGTYRTMEALTADDITKGSAGAKNKRVRD